MKLVGGAVIKVNFCYLIAIYHFLELALELTKQRAAGYLLIDAQFLHGVTSDEKIGSENTERRCRGVSSLTHKSSKE